MHHTFNEGSVYDPLQLLFHMCSCDLSHWKPSNCQRLIRKIKHTFLFTGNLVTWSTQWSPVSSRIEKCTTGTTSYSILKPNKPWVYHMNHLWKAFALWAVCVCLCVCVCVCVFKEEINLASYTFACFLAPKPDLWTAGEEPPGTMSSLHNIWLVFQWSKPTRHYESNADENMFSTVNQQAFGGEEGLLVGGAQGVVERIWVTLRGNTTIR